MNNLEKPSYKNVVLEKPLVGVEASKDKEVLFGYNEIISEISLKKEKLHNKSKGMNNSKKELLIDLLNDIGNVTDYVRQYYGFHGIGNDLRLEDVMDCFEKSLIVEVVSDNDYDMISEDDET